VQEHVEEAASNFGFAEGRGTEKVKSRAQRNSERGFRGEAPVGFGKTATFSTSSRLFVRKPLQYAEKRRTHERKNGNAGKFNSIILKNG